MNAPSRLIGPCVAALALLASGCATIISGPNQKVRVLTEPPGATVTAGSQQIVSPGALELPRDAKATLVTIELAGYQTQTVTLHRRSNDVVWLDMLAAPLSLMAASSAAEASQRELTIGSTRVPADGFGIDYSSGAAYRLEPKKIVLTLQRLSKEDSQ